MDKIKELMKEYGIEENASFTLVDYGGYPVFKTYFKFKDGKLEEHMPYTSLVWPVNVAAFFHCIEMYKCTLKEYPEE